MYKQLTRGTNLVEKTLNNNPITRASDIRLILDVWNQEGLKLSREQENYICTQCSSPESIRRTRQKFHERRKYLPSPEVLKQRALEEEAIRNHFRGARQMF